MKKVLPASILRVLIFAVIAATFFLSGCAGDSDSSGKSIKIVHVNDVHSHLDAATYDVTLDNETTRIELGGIEKVAQKIKELRQQSSNTLVLHAGDAVQGTLYYTLFKGEADAEVMNEIGFDAMAIGNHEFDDGDEFLSGFIDMLDAPVISSNIVPDAGSLLDGKFSPYVIKEVDGEKVGIIGLTVKQKTVESSSPSDNLTFLDEAEALQIYVDELQGKGVEMIVVLSHYGYSKTKELVKSIPAIDVVVDGDSHTLLGDFDYLGLSNSGDYPTIASNADGDKVCIVQAWNYGYAVGDLTVKFDTDGKVESCYGEPVLISGDSFLRKNEEGNRVEIEGDARAAVYDIISAHANIDIVGDNASVATIKSAYSSQVDELKNQVIGEAGEDLLHNRIPGQEYYGVSLPLGSDIAPVVAKSFYELSLRSDLCIQNAGGVRVSINEGDITIGDAYTLLPFANTLFEIEMYGSEIKQVLEDAIEGIHQGGSTGGFPYAYALRYDVDNSQPFGSRVSNLEVMDRETKTWSSLEDSEMYVVVTNSYTAAGKDGYTTFGTVQEERGPGVDTYLDYAMSFVAYVEAREKAGEEVMKLPAAEHCIKIYTAGTDW
ncbi:NAD nucleotidase [Limisalsivibrio acetivorans]|uniref:NAD nucleotidase n=1 Tax=Limisalsivibrio acetivorans TaxID=1304888 RepID=UPI0003B6A669|nr:NAD nucleotidase [Limisalsivibrio acetivorans]